MLPTSQAIPRPQEGKDRLAFPQKPCYQSPAMSKCSPRLSAPGSPPEPREATVFAQVTRLSWGGLRSAGSSFCLLIYPLYNTWGPPEELRTGKNSLLGWQRTGLALQAGILGRWWPCSLTALSRIPLLALGSCGAYETCPPSLRGCDKLKMSEGEKLFHFILSQFGLFLSRF